MNDKSMKQYSQLMVEIKLRVGAIDDILNGNIPGYDRILKEYCYLQLRLICETIALGAIIIHENLNINSSIKDSYKADKIIKRLEKLHPSFFPKALEIPDGMRGGIKDWIHKKDGFLSQQDLIVLYHRCGHHLHRGRVKNIADKHKPTNLSKIFLWRDKIVGLLNKHIIETKDKNNIFYCIMNDGKGNVHYALFENIGFI